MFERILIANRGEIACRVIESCRRLGVATVAVYSEADADARHVALADEAVCIGGPQPAESYLRGEAIIAAAQQTGAQAIHPGYGFLSENPEFVEAIEAAGLTFIGPSADAIRKMGLKDAAKALMADAGVPVVPGYHGAEQSAAHLAAEADQIGYPVLIKAVAGGGGKGMRLVEDAADFAAALESAQTEAQKAFGNAAVLIEKFVSHPRHIEVQVFGDGQNAVHLYERDCSLQRRHQKVIEEAPAPGMTAEMRAAMGDAAVRAAKAIGYAGAGTIEFIVDGSGPLRPDGFWFMEMNTRLQVEHPVTEEVTGIDLVEWQLRVASGEPLPRSQEEITLTGHAFEARLYAEDAGAGFLPATGTLTHLSFPQDARIDTGVRSGDTITPFYDPMVAKITTLGPTRATALARLRQALAHTQVAGTVTNLAFLRALAAHAGFARGEVDTGLIARDFDALVAQAPARPEDWALAALAVADVAPAPLSGFTLWAPLAQAIALEHEDESAEVVLHMSGPDHVRADVAEATVELTRRPHAARAGGAPAVWGTPVAVSGAELTVFGPATQWFRRPDPTVVGGAVEEDGVTRAPMPGHLRALDVKVGDVVAAGDRLCVLEAMKMEHALKAGAPGEVIEVLAEPGQQVEEGAPLVRLALAEDDGAA